MMGFDPSTKMLRLEAIHEGVEIQEVLDNTGFDLPISPSLQKITPPNKRELKLLRQIDPEKVMLRGG
jgi:glutaconate CoA-transferase subunit B